MNASWLFKLDRARAKRGRTRIALQLAAFLLAVLPPTAARAAESQLPLAAGKSAKIRVALYCDLGSLKAAPAIEKCLTAVPDRFQLTRLTAQEIREGGLQKCDVVVHGGGSGSKQGTTLEQKGRDEVRRFVENGGGYLGICAGAYLATADYDWSLHILNAKVIDKKHWARGHGKVDLRVTPSGAKLLGIEKPSLACLYYQGPLLAPAAEAKLPGYTALTVFDSEIAQNGAPKGIMIGTTAMACGQFGKGRVFVSSPHPEKTKGLDGIVRTAIVWLARQEIPARARSLIALSRFDPL
jgi:hypothetical protein